MQVAVVSFSRGCAEPGLPGMYAQLSAYQPWIQHRVFLLGPFSGDCQLPMAPPDILVSFLPSCLLLCVPSPICLAILASPTHPPTPAPLSSSFPQPLHLCGQQTAGAHVVASGERTWKGGPRTCTCLRQNAGARMEAQVGGSWGQSALNRKE